MDLDIKQARKLVNEKLDLTKILKKANPHEYYAIGQTCFCPFHDNQDTKAGAIYENDETGEETLWCFSEKVLYTSSHAVELLLKQDIYAVAAKLWARMTDQEQAGWLSRHSHEDYAAAFSSEDSTVDKTSTEAEYQAIKRSYKSGH